MLPRIALLVLAGCSGAAAPAPKPPAAEPPKDELVARVGKRPRAVATMSLHDPVIAEWLAGIDAVPQAFGGKPFSACGLDFAKLDRIRVAVGEPLVVAAELDGAITTDQARCVLGDQLLAMLDAAQFRLRDRAGGISITRGAFQPAPMPPRGAELAARCTGKAVCAAAVLGPAGHELEIDFAVSGQRLTWRLAGPGLGRDTADAFAAAIAADPALASLVVHRSGDELVATFMDTRDTAVREALKAHLLEAFRVPSSSMVPTLQVGDNVFALKGALRGKLEPGTVVVYRYEDRLYIKRIVAIAGQTVTETSSGLSVDGTSLPTEPLARHYHYLDYDLDAGRDVPVEGRVVRERLAGRSHLILRKTDGHPGSWTVPAGSYFLVGDNRDNSNDSRFLGAVPEEAIVGRVLGIWLAMHDGAPDWNRMGTPIDAER